MAALAVEKRRPIRLAFFATVFIFEKSPSDSTLWEMTSLGAAYRKQVRDLSWLLLWP